MSAGAAKEVELSSFSVARLLFALLRQRFTGTVQLSQPDFGDKTIWFRGGMPIYTDWTSHADVLGEVLMRDGKISDVQLMEALQTMASDGGLLGQILVKQGTIDQATLRDGLRLQCARKLVQLFALREGRALATPVEHGLGKGDELTGQVNVLSLIRVGVLKHYNEDRVRSEMGQLLDGLLVAAPAFEKYAARFGFRPDDQVTLREVARGTSLDRLALPGLSRKRIAQILFTLWACQMMLTGEQAKAAEVHAPPPPPPLAEGMGRDTRPTTLVGLKDAATSASDRPKPATLRATTNTPAVLRPDSVEVQRVPKPGSSSPKASKPPPAPQAKPKSKPAPARPEPTTPFEEELVGLEKKIDEEVHAFELFGLPTDATRKDVRAVWADLSKRFHPDAQESEGRSHLTDRVEHVFAALSEASGVLQNKEKREQLAKLIETGGDKVKRTSDAGRVVRNAFEADLIVREAEKLLRANNFERAAERYRAALELSPEEVDAKAGVAWCEFQLSKRETGDIGRAELQLRTIIEGSPANAKPHYYLGMILLSHQPTAAKAAFKAALKADRRFVDAERQLRALEIKARQNAPSKDDEKKGPFGLGKFFGRK